MKRLIPTRTTRWSVVVPAAMAMALVPLATIVLPTSPASAASRVPVATASPRALSLNAGTSAEIAVRLSSNRPSNLRWSIDGRPSGVSAGVACSSARLCAVTVTADSSAPESTALVEIVLRSGSASRVIPFALHIAPLATPAPPVTTPTTTAPPTTTPPTTGRTLSLRPDSLISTANPGTRSVFVIGIARNGWSGPVDMTVETLPSGWRAAFLPNPANDASSTLIIDNASNATPGDYPIRISGRAAGLIGESMLIVRVRAPELTLSMLSLGPVVAPGGTTRFVLDVRSIDDPTRLVNVRADGLPAGVTYVVSPNPAVGTVTVDVSVPGGTPAVVYAFYFVGSRDGVEVRLPTVLSVVAPAVSTFTFTPTAVAPVPGDAFGFGIFSTSSSFSLSRGTSASFDVQVVPRAGFVSPIDLSLTTPTGWTVTWLAVGPNVFRVTVTAPASAASGVNILPLRSSSGALTATLNFTATIA